MSVRKFAERGQGECPICMEQVDSLKLLPCSHSLCAMCLERLKEIGASFSCPSCRQLTAINEEFLTQFCGLIECSRCLRMKEADEFYWCTECAAIICCRCLAKDHGFSTNQHTLHEWGTKKAYQACFKNISGNPKSEKDELERILTQLFIPIAKSCAAALNSKTNDAVLRVKREFGMDATVITATGPTKNSEEILRFLNALSGIQIEGNTAKSYPSGWKDPTKLIEMIQNELIFSSEPPKHQEVTETPRGQPDIVPLLQRSSSVSSIASSTSAEKGILKITTNPIKKDPAVLLSIGKRTKKDIAVIGPNGSLVHSSKELTLYDSHNKYFRAWNFNNRHPCFKSVAIDELNSRHCITFEAAGETNWFYSYENCSGNGTLSSDLNIPPVPAGEKISGMLICCTDTGVPFIVAHTLSSNSQKNNNRIAIFRRKSECPKDQKYDTIEFVHNIEDTIITSCQAVRKAQQSTFLLAADQKSVHIFTKGPMGAFSPFSSILIRSPSPFKLVPIGSTKGFFAVQRTNDADKRKIKVDFISLDKEISKIGETETVASFPALGVGFKNGSLCSIAFDTERNAYVFEDHNIKISFTI